MKTKKWSLKDGAVVPASPFIFSPMTVTARTKADALKMLLLKLEAIETFGAPYLRVKNGAFLLAHHTGDHICVSSGLLSDASKEMGRVFGSCISYAKTLSEADKDSGFAYYASEEFQKQRGEQAT